MTHWKHLPKTNRLLLSMCSQFLKILEWNVWVCLSRWKRCHGLYCFLISVNSPGEWKMNYGSWMIESKRNAAYVFFFAVENSTLNGNIVCENNKVFENPEKVSFPHFFLLANNVGEICIFNLYHRIIAWLIFCRRNIPLYFFMCLISYLYFVLSFPLKSNFPEVRRFPFEIPRNQSA